MARFVRRKRRAKFCHVRRSLRLFPFRRRKRRRHRFRKDSTIIIIGSRYEESFLQRFVVTPLRSPTPDAAAAAAAEKNDDEDEDEDEEENSAPPARRPPTALSADDDIARIIITIRISLERFFRAQKCGGFLILPFYSSFHFSLFSCVSRV